MKKGIFLTLIGLAINVMAGDYDDPRYAKLKQGALGHVDIEKNDPKLELLINSASLEHLSTNSQVTKSRCKSICKKCLKCTGSVCVLGGAIAVPVIAALPSVGYGGTIASVPALHFCAEQWSSQSEKVKKCACCCMTVSALTACALFYPINMIDTCALWGCSGFKSNLGISACYIGTKLFGDCLGKFKCTRAVGKNTGKVLGKISDKCCVNTCCGKKLDTCTSCLRDKVGISWENEEAKPEHQDLEMAQVVGLDVLEDGLRSDMSNIQAKAPLMVAEAQRLLTLIAGMKDGHISRNAQQCKKLWKRYVAFTNDYRKATEVHYQEINAQQLKELAQQMVAVQRRLGMGDATTAPVDEVVIPFSQVAGGGATPEKAGKAE